MSILAWIVFGGLAGLVAGLLTGGGGGIIYDIIVGIVGAFLGGFLMSLIRKTGVTGWNWRSFGVAVVGAGGTARRPACGPGTRKSLKAGPLIAFGHGQRLASSEAPQPALLPRETRWPPQRVLSWNQSPWRGIFTAGEADQAKGRTKKAVGELTDDEDLKREGEIDETTGKVKKAVGEVADKAREVVQKK